MPTARRSKLPENPLIVFVNGKTAGRLRSCVLQTEQNAELVVGVCMVPALDGCVTIGGKVERRGRLEILARAIEDRRAVGKRHAVRFVRLPADELVARLGKRIGGQGRGHIVGERQLGHLARCARAAQTTVQQVNKLVQQYEQTAEMMKKFSKMTKGGKKGFGKFPGMGKMGGLGGLGGLGGFGGLGGKNSPFK